MGLVCRTDGRRYHCHFLPVSVTLVHVLIISTVISVIAANNITTSFPTTPSFPEDECTETCDTCKQNDTNACTTCKDELTFNPADNCIDLLPDLLIECGSKPCMDECYPNGTDNYVDCQCLLKECPECDLSDMYGTCVEDCPRNTEAKDGIFMPTNMTVCVECNDILFGYCVERYLKWIILVPVGIFLVLIIVVVVVVCLICRRRKRGLDVEEEGCYSCRCIKNGSKKPEIPIQPDYPTVQRPSHQSHGRGYQYNSGNSLQMDDVQPPEPTEDDTYGNVDNQDNIKMHMAPEPEQISLRPPLKAPQNRPPMNHPQNNGALNDPSTDDTQDAFYGNDDSIRRGGGRGYIQMKGNVHVELPQLPSQPSSRHVSESEDQPLYTNDKKLARHETAPVRRPPSIPKPKTSSTLPGRINQGYDDDDDESPTDDYPEFLDDEERIDSLPTDFAPPPPLKHNKNDISGGGGHLSELQQKLTKLRKESLSDLPEEPPPPIPSPSRTPMHPSPNRKPPPMPKGGHMSELQRKLSSSLNNRPDAFLLPSKPSVSPLRSPQEESDSDEGEENYEFVDYKDGDPLPESPTRLNAKRPPLAHPKSPKRKDSSTRPPLQTPIKKDPSSRPPIQTPIKKDPSRPPVAIPTQRTNYSNKPPPLPTSPKPELQELYEVVETADDAPDRPRMPPPGEHSGLEQDDIYEPIDNPDFGDDYVVTQVPMVSPKLPATVFQEADDIYQNEPVIKGKSGHGRYRNLPADKNPAVVKGKEGHTGWAKVSPELQRKAKQDPASPRPRYISTAAQYIDIQGGVVHLADVNVTLKIPEGALPPGKRVEISLTVDTNEAHPTLEGEDQLIMGQVITCKPDGLKFLKPVTLSVSHSGIHISEECLQVWCKQEDTELAEAIWWKIYDGLKFTACTHDESKSSESESSGSESSESGCTQNTRVLVEENKIKLRVDHFTGFDFVTAPMAKMWNWLKPSPEQLLVILAYMDPAEVMATTRHVCLRVYAVKATDVASRELIKQYEDENGDSGMCSLPSGFVLKANGKSLSVIVKNIHPEQKWLPVDTMEGLIPYTLIQNGGQVNDFPAARCEIRFLSGNDVDHADIFEASLDISQEENVESTVKGVYVTNRKALTYRNNVRNAGQAQIVPPPMNQPHPVGEPPIAPPGPRQAQNIQPEIMWEPPVVPQSMEIRHAKRRSQAQNVPPQPPPGTDDVRRKQNQKDSRGHRAPFHSLYQSNQQSIPTLSNTAASCRPESNQRKRYLVEEDLRNLILPSSISYHGTAASSKQTQLDGDCGPFLKSIARKITSRWKQVAKVLEFSPDQCEEFERNSTIKEPWWPAYKMLLAWKTKLPKDEYGQFFKMLSEAIQTFGDF